MAPEQAHFLQPPERAVERPVGGQEPPVRDGSDMLCDLVAMEFINACVLKLGGGRQNRCLERDQSARLASHVRSISRYMLIVSSCLKAWRPPSACSRRHLV